MQKDALLHDAQVCLPRRRRRGRLRLQDADNGAGAAAQAPTILQENRSAVRARELRGERKPNRRETAARLKVLGSGFGFRA